MIFRDILNLFLPRLSMGVVGCTTLPGNAGALLWDMGAQGSDHTHQPGSPVNVYSNPENMVFADAGVICVDVLGQMYVKTTSRDLCTGWCEVACVPQNQT